MSTPLIREAVAALAEFEVDPASFHWFDISQVRGFPSSEASTKLLQEARPPFNQCMVVDFVSIASGNNHTLMMAVNGDDPKQGIYFIPLSATAHGRLSDMHFYAVDDAGDIVCARENSKQLADRKVVAPYLALLATWYAALAAKPVESYIPVVRDDAASKKRVRKGKAPLYEWRTVVVGGPKTVLEPQGGTHAPPRLHDRRGHQRRLRSGKVVWVRPCKVGNAARGMVFHDYEVRA